MLNRLRQEQPSPLLTTWNSYFYVYLSHHSKSNTRGVSWTVILYLPIEGYASEFAFLVAGLGQQGVVSSFRTPPGQHPNWKLRSWISLGNICQHVSRIRQILLIQCFCPESLPIVSAKWLGPKFLPPYTDTKVTVQLNVQQLLMSISTMHSNLQQPQHPPMRTPRSKMQLGP